MKRSKKAAVFSTLFMGAGQFYNKDFVKGIVFAFIEALVLINIPVFKHNLWGLITLGEKSMFETKSALTADHSIFLLIEGILGVIFLSLFVIVYIFNIIDAKKMGEKIENGGKALPPIKFIKYLWEKYFPHIMLTPAFIFTVFFVLLPIIFTFTLAFTNYSKPNHLPPMKLVDWVGFKNFKELFKMDIWNNTFLHVAGWTVIWAVITTVLNYGAGLVLALLTNAKGIKLKKLWRTIFILPYAVPAFISLLVMRMVFSGPGPVNEILKQFGINAVPWFTNPVFAKVMIIAISCWLGAPYFMVLMSGVLTNISGSLYEAAEIDGATKWQQFWKITLPMVLFQTAPLLIMNFAYNFNNFGLIYLLTDGNPVNGAYKYAGSTDILISWIYKMTKDQSQFHMAAAVSIVLFIFIAAVSIFSFLKTKSFKEEDMM